jgi:predicted transcriptional regulator
MKEPLLDVIFASEERKNTLLLLHGGPKDMEYLLKSLDTSRKALLPQIRILEKHHLVGHSADTYDLTTLGRIIVDKMLPLLGTVEVFDSDIDYWGTRDLEFIPPHLYTRLQELGTCTMVTAVPLTEVYEPSKQAVENAKRSTYQFSVTTFLFPTFPLLLEDFGKNGTNMRLVVSTELLTKIKEGQNGHLRELLKSDLNELYLYPKRMGFMAFGHNDFSFMMRIFNKSGIYDHKYVSFYSPSALIWAKELFEYYLRDSTPIIEI